MRRLGEAGARRHRGHRVDRVRRYRPGWAVCRTRHLDRRSTPFFRLPDHNGRARHFELRQPDARAVDLPHERFGSYFLDTFDRPKRVSGCECERSTSATLSQVLLLANSDEVEQKLQNENSRIGKLFAAKRSTYQIVEDLYLAAFSRYPSTQEIFTTAGYIDRDPNPRKGAEDVLWSILNSREFLFNH